MVSHTVAVLRGARGGCTPPSPPNSPAGTMLCLRDLHGLVPVGQVTYVDQEIRTFFVTQDREKSTDSVQGAAAQESIDSVEGEESTISVERPTTHSVPSSSGCSGSTLSGTFRMIFAPPLPPTLYSCAHLCSHITILPGNCQIYHACMHAYDQQLS